MFIKEIMNIKKLNDNTNDPYSLLLLADPSKKIVDSYLKKGICYVAYIKGVEIGVYVLLKTKKDTMEIMNIAVKEDYQGKGIGKKLLLHAIEEIKKIKEIKNIEIGTGNSSIYQLLFYQKNGFRIYKIFTDFFTKKYTEKIYENEIECRDKIMLRMKI